MWIARDKYGPLCIYNTKPTQSEEGNWYIAEDDGIGDNAAWDYLQITEANEIADNICNIFPNLKYSDDPIEVELIPKKNMKKDNINGLPFLTIIERFMKGDKEIKELYKFEESSEICSKIVDSDNFLFDSSKIIKPDKVSFCYGIRWNFDELYCRKIINKDWKNDIVEYGSTVFVPFLFYQTYIEGIKFTYNKPRENSIVDEMFNIFEPYRSMSQKDFMDNIVVKVDGIEFGMQGVMLISKEFFDNKEEDRFSCDYFRILI